MCTLCVLFPFCFIKLFNNKVVKVSTIFVRKSNFFECFTVLSPHVFFVSCQSGGRLEGFYVNNVGVTFSKEIVMQREVFSVETTSFHVLL